MNDAGTYGRYLTIMNRNEAETPWYQIQFLSKLIVFINLRFRVKSEFEVKVGSHQLLMQTEVRILDEMAEMFCIYGKDDFLGCLSVTGF